MNYEDTVTAVKGYLKDNFTTYTLVPENRPFEPSNGQVWVRWGMRPNLEQPTDIGGKYARTVGFIWFQVFIPENTGALEAAKVGDALTALFFQKIITTTGKPSIICGAATLRYVGQEVSGATQWSVTVPYRVDSIGS